MRCRRRHRHRLHGHVGRERHGDRRGRAHRPAHRARGHCRVRRQEATAHGVRARDAGVRIPDHASHAPPGPRGDPRRRRPASAPARVVPVRPRSRRRPDARAPSHDRLGVSRARRAPDGREEGRREAARRDPRPRRHGRALHGQDRHAHRGAHRARAASRRARTGERARAPSRVPEQLVRDGSQEPARRRDPPARGARERLAVAEDRRGAVRLRAPAGLRPAGRRGAPPPRREGRVRGRAPPIDPL